MTDDTLLTNNHVVSYEDEIRKLADQMQRDRVTLEAVPMVRMTIHEAILRLEGMRPLCTGDEDLMLLIDGVLALLQELYNDLRPPETRADTESDPDHVVDETG